MCEVPGTERSRKWVPVLGTVILNSQSPFYLVQLDREKVPFIRFNHSL